MDYVMWTEESLIGSERFDQLEETFDSDPGGACRNLNAWNRHIFTTAAFCRIVG